MTGHRHGQARSRTGELRCAAARAMLDLVPRPVVRAMLRHVAGRIAARHPGLIERLAPLAGRAVIIDVDEFPEALSIAVAGPPGRIAIDPVPRQRVGAAAASISGGLAAFAAMVEGRADGDALFFQRSIRVEGDTEAVLLLRNALDASEIDLVGDVLPPLGPLAPVLRDLVIAAARLLDSNSESGLPWRPHR